MLIWIVGPVVAVAAAYQLIALAACFRHLLQPSPSPPADWHPGISILKPVRGVPPGFDAAISSHAEQDYSDFELLLGHHDPADLGIPAMDLAITRHPAIPIRRFWCERTAPNGKVGVLAGLIQQARYPVIVVSDADIGVPAGYLRDVTAPLADPTVGLVTCLYRAEGSAWPSRFEALGVATDFAPSALVAPLVGVSEFGFGSTLAFRRTDLEAIGGFAAVADYLADDYQLGAKIHRLGRRNVISRVVVITKLHETDWGGAWRHQLRWARTIRLSRFDGYIGLPVTFATLWAVLAGLLGFWWLALLLMAIRMAMAFTAAWLVLRSSDALQLLWLVPVRDLYGVVVWFAGLFGESVEWGGKVLSLDNAGKIRRVAPYSKVQTGDLVR